MSAGRHAMMVTMPSVTTAPTLAPSAQPPVFRYATEPTGMVPPPSRTSSHSPNRAAGTRRLDWGAEYGNLAESTITSNQNSPGMRTANHPEFDARGSMSRAPSVGMSGARQNSNDSVVIHGSGSWEGATTVNGAPPPLFRPSSVGVVAAPPSSGWPSDDEDRNAGSGRGRNVTFHPDVRTPPGQPAGSVDVSEFATMVPMSRQAHARKPRAPARLDATEGGGRPSDDSRHRSGSAPSRPGTIHDGLSGGPPRGDRRRPPPLEGAPGDEFAPVAAVRRRATSAGGSGGSGGGFFARSQAAIEREEEEAQASANTGSRPLPGPSFAAPVVATALAASFRQQPTLAPQRDGPPSHNPAGSWPSSVASTPTRRVDAQLAFREAMFEDASAGDRNRGAPTEGAPPRQGGPTGSRHERVVTAIYDGAAPVAGPGPQVMTVAPTSPAGNPRQNESRTAETDLPRIRRRAPPSAEPESVDNVPAAAPHATTQLGTTDLDGSSRRRPPARAPSPQPPPADNTPSSRPTMNSSVRYATNSLPLANNSSSNSVAALQEQAARSIEKRDTEILRLRASLQKVYVKMLLASGATVNGSVRGVGVDDVLPTMPGAPPHVGGVPLRSVALRIGKRIPVQAAALDVLDIEDRSFTKHKFRRRFVVADDRGVQLYKAEDDFGRVSYHRAELTLLYRQCDFFLPAFRNSTSNVAAPDGEPSGFHPYAADPSKYYFGFIVKQPGGNAEGTHSNPPLLFRTDSKEEYSDWVHFFSRCFNEELYRDMFPQLCLAPTIERTNGRMKDAQSMTRPQAPTPPPPPASAHASVQCLLLDPEPSVATTDRSAPDMSPVPAPPGTPPPVAAIAIATPDPRNAVAPAVALFAPKPPTCDVCVGSDDARGSKVVAVQTDDWPASEGRLPPMVKEAQPPTAVATIAAPVSAPPPTIIDDVVAMRRELSTTMESLRMSQQLTAASSEQIKQLLAEVEVLKGEVASKGASTAALTDMISDLTVERDTLQALVTQLTSEAVASAEASLRAHEEAAAAAAHQEVSPPPPASPSQSRFGRSPTLSPPAASPVAQHAMSPHQGGAAAALATPRNGSDEGQGTAAAFPCQQCEELYQELQIVVDERDALVREIARRHREYTAGIADMCEKVVHDIDYLHRQYRDEKRHEVLKAYYAAAMGRPASIQRRAADDVWDGASMLVGGGVPCLMLQVVNSSPPCGVTSFDLSETADAATEVNPAPPAVAPTGFVDFDARFSGSNSRSQLQRDIVGADFDTGGEVSFGGAPVPPMYEDSDAVDATRRYASWTSQPSAAPRQKRNWTTPREPPTFRFSCAVDPMQMELVEAKGASSRTDVIMPCRRSWTFATKVPADTDERGDAGGSGYYLDRHGRGADITTIKVDVEVIPPRAGVTSAAAMVGGAATPRDGRSRFRGAAAPSSRSSSATGQTSSKSRGMTATSPALSNAAAFTPGMFSKPFGFGSSVPRQ